MTTLGINMVPHLVVDLGWINFDLSVPPTHPTAKLLLSNYHQLRKSWANSGAIKIHLKPLPIYDLTGCSVRPEVVRGGAKHIEKRTHHVLKF